MFKFFKSPTSKVDNITLKATIKNEDAELMIKELIEKKTGREIESVRNKISEFEVTFK